MIARPRQRPCVLQARAEGAKLHAYPRAPRNAVTNLAHACAAVCSTGSLAKIGATVVTYPMIVVKSRLQVRPRRPGCTGCSP